MTDALAIHGGKPVRTKPFPEWPIFGDVEEQYLLRALRSGKWGRLAGNEVTQFEKTFADYHEAKYAVAVVNGTVGLRLALLAANIGEGDEVIVPPYTFLATASAVVESNATPIFADLGLDTFNIDPASVESLITPRTKAIIPVHVAGCPVDLDALQAICKRHKLTLIEDAAHAHGAEYKGRRVGAIGDMGMFSFQSSKNLCSGEGGIVVTNNEELATRLRSVHNCGRRIGRAWYEHFTIGGNYRLSEFQGAVLNAQWTRFDEQTTTRDRNGKYLAEQIAQIPGLYPQRRGPECTRHSYHLFAFRVVADEFGMARDAMIAALTAEGIPSLAGYVIPLYKQKLFEDQAFGPYVGCKRTNPDLDYGRTSCPNCETICYRQGAWFEQRMLLGTREDMDDIVAALKKIHANRNAPAKAK
jgi:dTDP-4-amino-4,6-dideoxygalactose transaminase